MRRNKLLKIETIDLKFRTEDASFPVSAEKIAIKPEIPFIFSNLVSKNCVGSWQLSCLWR